jgi:hypothetical protein
MSQTHEGPPIVRGYPWRLELSAAGQALFPLAATFLAHVRPSRGSDSLLATLTTQNGGITRIADDTVVLEIPALATADMTSTHVELDLVDTSIAPGTYLNIWMRVPVIQPVTRMPA